MNIYIVAGNHYEFMQYKAKKIGDGNKYIYVADVITLRGVNNPRGFYIGSFQNRADINDISQEIKIRQFASHGKPATYVWMDEYEDIAAQKHE